MSSKVSEYSLAFADFRRLSSDYADISLWLKRNMTDILRETLAITGKSRIERDPPFRLLSIGCGTGEFDKQIINQAQMCSTNILYSAIDPDMMHVEKFKRNMCNDVEGDRTEVYQMTVEDYEKHFRLNGIHPYHFISSIHSFYYFKDATSTIGFLYNKCLQPGSTMLFMISSPDAGQGLLAKEFAHDLNRSAFGQCQLADVMDETLSRLKLPFEVKTFTSEIDVGICFEDTEEGNRLLDFLCAASHVRHNGATYFDRLIQRLRELSSDVDGKFMLHYKTNVYIIKKPN